MIPVLALLAGCGGVAPLPKTTPTPVVAAPPPPLRSIRISYGNCYGECPIFTVTVLAGGHGKFEGEGFTRVSGERAFSVSSEQFVAVAVALEPVRLAASVPLAKLAEGGPLCDEYRTDHPNRLIVWTEVNGEQRAMMWNTGCSAKRYEGVQPAIDKALAVLPVGPWIAGAH